MAKKKAIVQKELTIDELFAKEVQSREIENIPIPPSRILEIGSKVRVGNLENCVVQEVREDNRFILVNYSKMDNNYGKPVTTHNLLGVWPWMSVLRLSDMQETNMTYKRHWGDSYRQTEISSLLHMVYRRGLIDSPDYQRGYVWSLKDKQRYIESVFESRDLGKLVFLEDPSLEDNRVEILDGKQRLSAIMGYFESRFSFGGVFFHELSGRDRQQIESRSIQYALLNRHEMKKSDLLKLFLDINCAGVPQTEEHLIHVKKLYEEAIQNEKA